MAGEMIDNLGVRAIRRRRRSPRGRPTVFGPRLIEFAHRHADLRGLFRVFNAAGYRFYRSSVAPPEEGDSPFATNTSLPYTPAATFGDGTWYLSVSYFNGVIDSGFLPIGARGETYRRLTIVDGASVGVAPATPGYWHVEQAAGGAIRILALYYEDGSGRAGQWAIATTIDGTDPPAGDPDLTEDVYGDPLSILDYELPAQAGGTTVKVRLQVRRNDGTEEVPVWTYSADSEIATIVADDAGPAAPRDATAWPGSVTG